MLHNGAHLGVPPVASVDKAMSIEGSKANCECMYVTPAGIYAILLPKYKSMEKIIPWANIYEADLVPESEDKKK